MGVAVMVAMRHRNGGWTTIPALQASRPPVPPPPPPRRSRDGPHQLSWAPPPWQLEAQERRKAKEAKAQRLAAEAEAETQERQKKEAKAQRLAAKAAAAVGQPKSKKRKAQAMERKGGKGEKGKGKVPPTFPIPCRSGIPSKVEALAHILKEREEGQQPLGTEQEEAPSSSSSLKSQKEKQRRSRKRKSAISSSSSSPSEAASSPSGRWAWHTQQMADQLRMMATPTSPAEVTLAARSLALKQVKQQQGAAPEAPKAVVQECASTGGLLPATSAAPVASGQCVVNHENPGSIDMADL